jgi:hypothetical protein
MTGAQPADRTKEATWLEQKCGEAIEMGEVRERSPRSRELPGRAEHIRAGC